MSPEIREGVGPVVNEIRDLFLHPRVADDFFVQPTSPELDGVIRFLCEEREFSRDRVSAALSRAFGTS
jgi:flap endonuclease-1